MVYKIDMHVHFDEYMFMYVDKGTHLTGFENPKYQFLKKGKLEDVIYSAVKRNVGVGFAQQNRLDSSMKGVKYWDEKVAQGEIPSNLLCIAGEEVLTREGEFMAFGHRKEVGPCWDPYKAMDEVHRQGGAVIIEHPMIDLKVFQGQVPLGMSWKFLTKPETAKRIDAIEMINVSTDVLALISKKSRLRMAKAHELCRMLGKNQTAGTDNHIGDAGLAYTIFKSNDPVSELKYGTTGIGVNFDSWPSPMYYLKMAAEHAGTISRGGDFFGDALEILNMFSNLSRQKQ